MLHYRQVFFHTNIGKMFQMVTNLPYCDWGWGWADLSRKEQQRGGTWTTTPDHCRVVRGLPHLTFVGWYVGYHTWNDAVACFPFEVQ